MPDEAIGTGAPALPERRRFLRVSGATLGWLALACDGGRITAVPPPVRPSSPLVPGDHTPVETELAGPVGVVGPDGELVAYFGAQSSYLWPAGGARPGPRFRASSVPEGPSGAYGFQLDRPVNAGWPLDIIFSIDGQRTWELGLDYEDDASGQGIGPDYVLAYDSSSPTGDRFRMAPGGYTLHSMAAGTPSTFHRFHIVGGTPAVDKAKNILYLQSGTRNGAGAAEWLLIGQGYHIGRGEWGHDVFAVSVEGKIHGSSVVTAMAGAGEHDLVRLETGEDGGRGWLCWSRGEDVWRMGFGDDGAGLELACGATPRFAFGAGGDVYADLGLYTFSPTPPLPAAGMSARGWCDWAFEDACKPVKPYDGVPSACHPVLLEEAQATGAAPAELARREHATYGKDVAKIAIGTAHWAKHVQSALERAGSFDEFRRLLADD